MPVKGALPPMQVTTPSRMTGLGMARDRRRDVGARRADAPKKFPSAKVSGQLWFARYSL